MLTVVNVTRPALLLKYPGELVLTPPAPPVMLNDQLAVPFSNPGFKMRFAPEAGVGVGFSNTVGVGVETGGVVVGVTFLKNALKSAVPRLNRETIFGPFIGVELAPKSSLSSNLVSVENL